jgi:asparagine synthase (glutamine-hydrolysing)
MCGIICALGVEIKSPGSLDHRGPDGTERTKFGRCSMEFARLSINDTSYAGMQPFLRNDKILICNGEIYNHKSFPFPIKMSDSDCECLIPAIEKFGIHEVCKRIRGVFAFCYSDGNSLQVARDPLGVRPLFYTRPTINSICFASEVKSLLAYESKVEIFPPGHFYDSEFDTFTCYYQYSWDIKNVFEHAVRIRIENTDRAIGFLLSGGLDSSLVASIAKMQLKKRIKTFSIGTGGETSPDVVAARKMATFLNSDHTEVLFDIEEGIKNLENVIWSLESYDTTTVRASVPMWLLSKHISENSDCKVILSGEGSDELFGGYLYFHYAPSVEDFTEENRRRLKLIHQFDGLRADRCTAAHGLELRVPFLDRSVVKFGMTMDQTLKMPKDGVEKWYLRKAFEGYLPDEILWRQKNGMSDAVGYAWVKAVKAHAESVVSDNEFEAIKFLTRDHNPTLTKEEALYRKIFWEKFGKDKDHLISEIWRPKWTTQTDPSATQLGVFST